MTRLARAGVVALLLAPALLGAQPRRVTVMIRGYGQPVMLDTLASYSDIAEPPARVFNAAVKVLDELKLTRTDHDAAHGLLANRMLTARVRLAGHPMSWMIHGGSDMLGDYADTWRVSLAWAVYVDSVGPAASRLGIALLAGANNVEGAYKPAVACGSTGSLETDIAKRVRLVLASN